MAILFKELRNKILYLKQKIIPEYGWLKKIFVPACIFIRKPTVENNPKLQKRKAPLEDGG